MPVYEDLLEQKNMTIRMLFRLLIIAVVAIIVIANGWSNAQDEIDVHYPPNITVSTTMKAGYIPEETIYAFVPLILQQLFLWENNGAEDYEKNRYRLRQFLTPKFSLYVHSQIEKGVKAGTLNGIKRSMQMMPDSVYKDVSVQMQGKHWVVWIDTIVKDTIKGVPIDDKFRRMAVRVVRYDINRDLNPWGLAIDGIEKQIPIRAADDVEMMKVSRKENEKGDG